MLKDEFFKKNQLEEDKKIEPTDLLPIKPAIRVISLR
jgi:hypothetical protein